MNQIDTSRHNEVFSVENFGNRRIDVIGAGSVGSEVVIQLAKLGIENIHVSDFDKVEKHNIANQRYAPKHIGQVKVVALAEIVKEVTGHDITIYERKLEGGEVFGDVVILAVDKMSARKAIWEKSLRNKLRTKLMIETRMGAAEGMIYTICPIKQAQIRGYEQTLYEDAQAVVSACGTSTTVGATAGMTADYAVWQFMRWAALAAAASNPAGVIADVNAPVDVLDNEILFGMRPLYLMTRKFT